MGGKRRRRANPLSHYHPIKPDLDYFKHPLAIVESEHIGPRTRIWAFTHVLPGAVIGADCNICDHVFIEDAVRVGNRVTVKCGVQLWNGVVVEDDAFVGPNATFTNDPFPRSRKPPPEFLGTVIKAGASIGANATILPGIVVGRNAMVAAGAVVTQNVPANAIVVGNPAYINGYLESDHRTTRLRTLPGEMTEEMPQPSVRGVTIYPIPIIADLRGSLAAVEIGRELPFQPRRSFIVFDVPNRKVRGAHAHRDLHQFLVCLKGDCSLLVEDGNRREEILLDSPRIGVHLPPMIWAVQYKFSRDAVLLVLASEVYDPASYIRDYEEYCRIVKST